ncbi:2Fe-2S iron-sulfur cluster binding domain-containing protein [candidate division WOR-3 bacterium]|nr:2Fe-2S iron-sulfur cluster binding domain-containing protein [candidate division WOR-3 bacterium]
MIETLIISGIGAFLALLLVFAERVITNYGEVNIDINNGTRKIKIRGGGSLLAALTEEKLFIPSACGGRGTCGYCKVKVLEGAGPFLPTEEPFIDTTERTAGVRLSCQIKVRNELKIEIPDELLTIREYRTTCEKIIDLTYDIKQFNLKLIEPSAMKYKPGQYVQVLAPANHKSTEEVYRAYSISSDPADTNRIELIVRRVPDGICTTYLFDYLKQGDTVRINGPYGHFYLRETDAPIIFIAGGSGIAPIKCMLHHMKNTNNTRKAVFFFGVRTTKDLFLVDEMEAFEKFLANFTYIPVLSQPEEDAGWKGTTGWVTTASAEYLKRQPDAKDYEAYLCGSPGMIDSAIKVLIEAGISEQKHYYDKFT